MIHARNKENKSVIKVRKQEINSLVTMPCCCVTGCHNRAEKGHKLYKLPQGIKNSMRRKLWIQNIGRNSLPIHAYVCQAHFTNDQFELRRADQKKLLKWNAVPTIFSHNEVNNHKTPVTQQIVTNVPALEEDSFTEEIIKTESVMKETNMRNSRSNGSIDEVTTLRSELHSSRKQIHTLKTIVSQLQAIIEKLIAENYVDEIDDPA